MTTIEMTALDTLEVRRRARPLPGPSEVVVDIKSVGICGSDAAYLHHGRIGDWVVYEPFVLGHEAAGVVSAIGEDVSPELLRGRVAIEPGTPCRTCSQCIVGRYHLCPDLAFLATPPYSGALSEQIAIPADQVHLIPDSMSFDEAALVEPASVGLWACRRVSLSPGEAVLVTGAGPVGVLAGLVARSLGASRIVISDPSPIRRSIAASLGLQAVEPGSEPDPPDAAVKTFDVLIECSGSEQALQSGLRLVGLAGRVGLVGMPHQDYLAIPVTALIPREISLFTVNRYAHTWSTVIELIADGRVPTDGLVTHHFDLDQSPQAFAAQQHDPNAMKVMIHA